MHKHIYTILRFSALLSKFIFVILANKYFEPTQLVDYFYVNFIVVFAVYFVNFDVSLSTTRQFFSSEAHSTKEDIMSFHYSFLWLSSIVGAGLLIIYLSFFVNVALAYLGGMLFLGEYISKDTERWLVLHELQSKAAASLFIRVALPTIINAMIFFYDASIYLVLIVSIFFSFIAITFGMVCIRNIKTFNFKFLGKSSSLRFTLSYLN